MEEDTLKRYIQKHKAEFETEEPDEAVFGNIIKQINIQKAKKRANTYTWLALVASVVLVMGLLLYLKEEQATPIIQPIVKSKVEVPNPVKNELKKEVLPVLTKEKLPLKPSKITHKPIGNQEIEKQLMVALQDSLSTANRLNAILKMDNLTKINEDLRLQLCHIFSHDENSTVRLAALGQMSKYPENFIGFFIAELDKQNDSSIQLELIKILGNNKIPLIDQKLNNIINNPQTDNLVRNQVYYTLIANN